VPDGSRCSKKLIMFCGLIGGRCDVK
jgi:hypothetical protein